MDFAIAGGAEAERAIKGAVVSALRPPMLLKEVLKLEPLKYKFIKINYLDTQ